MRDRCDGTILLVIPVGETVLLSTRVWPTSLGVFVPHKVVREVNGGVEVGLIALEKCRSSAFLAGGLAGPDLAEGNASIAVSRVALSQVNVDGDFTRPDRVLRCMVRCVSFLLCHFRFLLIVGES